MATSLPGMYGTVAQAETIAAMKAGPVHIGHGVVPDPSITRNVKDEDTVLYENPLPVASALGGFDSGANPDRTPRTHAAPTASWALMSAGEAGALASSFHSAKFVEPRGSQYSPPNVMGETLINDVSTGTNHLARDIPRQVRGQSDDITQGGGVGNGYGYDSAHVIRYVSNGWVPTWMVGSNERPIRMDPLQGRDTRFNVASRYGPGGDVKNLTSPNAGPPTAYVAAPNPQTNPLGVSSSGFAW